MLNINFEYATIDFYILLSIYFENNYKVSCSKLLLNVYIENMYQLFLSLKYC